MKPVIIINNLRTKPTNEPQLSKNNIKENFNPTTLTIILKNPVTTSKNPKMVNRFLYLLILYIFEHNIDTYAFY
jgi:hypothetical protein